MYNSFIDLYINPKTKVVLSLIDSIILIIFYSSLTDFYYLGPYLLNLVSSIKFVCNSKEINTKIIYENLMDINTMICDLIGFFNGFTRALCQDYNCYLGCDAIYNERCFLHLRKNNNGSLLVMCRERSGSNDYFQLKSLGQIKPKQREKMSNNNDTNNEDKIEVKNQNIFKMMKFKKNEKKKEYLTFDYNNYKPNRKYVYERDNKNNEMKINDLVNHKLENSMVSNNLDLPSESQIFDENDENINNNLNNNEYGQIMEVFDFINNVTKKNDEKEIIYNYKPKIIKDKKNISLSKSYNFKKEPNLNSEDNYKIFRHQKSNEIKRYELNKHHNYDRAKTTNFDLNITLKNMELIKSINFDDLENDYDYNDNIHINKAQNMTLNYDNIMKESLMNNFNKINNKYIDEEISQVFNQTNNNNINSNNLNNNNWNNNNYKINNNNIYYPTQNVINENNNNFNMTNNSSQSIVPYIPQLNFNNNNNNYSQPINSPFSQNDLSFLRGYSKVDNLKEDFIKIDKKNPNIISELKEKICYYHLLSQDNNNELKNISFKGYIGINIRPPNIINNKEFYINFLTEKWKDYNYFTNREFNKKLEQITENIYKINLLKQKTAVKLITYLINRNLIEKINLIKAQIKIGSNILIYKFDYLNNIYENIKRTEIIIEYKHNYQIFNDISTDGNITENTNEKTYIIFKNYIKEGKILFPNNNIYLYIKKINIQIILKNTPLSNMNFKISFSNSTNQSQETLPCRKISLLSFQYE